MNGAAPLFCLEDLTLTHEGCAQPVLRDVSFCLHPGEHIGLYGPNGCGKTTLLRGITGLHKATRGGVRFQGRLLCTDADFHPLRCAVGFVLQHAEDQLFFPTVLEDVAFGPLNLGLGPDAARERALETLARLGLGGFADRQTHALSGGETCWTSPPMRWTWLPGNVCWTSLPRCPPRASPFPMTGTSSSR